MLTWESRASKKPIFCRENFTMNSVLINKQNLFPFMFSSRVKIDQSTEVSILKNMRRRTHFLECIVFCFYGIQHKIQLADFEVCIFYSSSHSNKYFPNNACTFIKMSLEFSWKMKYRTLSVAKFFTLLPLFQSRKWQSKFFLKSYIRNT